MSGFLQRLYWWRGKETFIQNTDKEFERTVKRLLVKQKYVKLENSNYLQKIYSVALLSCTSSLKQLLFYSYSPSKQFQMPELMHEIAFYRLDIFFLKRIQNRVMQFTSRLLKQVI